MLAFPTGGREITISVELRVVQTGREGSVVRGLPDYYSFEWHFSF